MLFSIIIPVYNVEKYLKECLESILKQIKEFENQCEILLIDDGSTDASGQLCDIYRENYPNIIRVIHNKNQGLLLTRRCGYAEATGQYIVNCDSDDMLEMGALRKLQRIIEEYKEPDVILFNFNSYDGTEKREAFRNLFTDGRHCKVEKKDVLKEFMLNHSVVSVWGKIYKKTCVDLMKDYTSRGRINNGEDSLQSIEFYNRANTFVYLNEALYDYRSDSGMTGKFDANYYDNFKIVFDEIWGQRENWQLENFEELFSVKVLQTAGRAITQSRYNNWSSWEDHREYLKKLRKDEMLNNSFRYMNCVGKCLQKDHLILLIIFRCRMYILIMILLRTKNRLDINIK